MTPYAPPKTGQIDGSAFAQSNCTWACTNDHIDAATMGRVRPGSAHLRHLSGDTSGGSSYNQNADVAATYGVKLDVLGGLSRAQFRDLVAAGHRCSISIYTGVTHGTARATGQFIGGHSVFVNATRWRAVGQACGCEKKSSAVAHREYYVEDPGTTSAGYLWWSASLLCRAAEARSAQYGGTGILALAGPDTESVTTTARAATMIRASTSTTAAAVGTIAKGQSVRGGSSTNGSAWTLADGSHGTGWIKISTGHFAPGGALH